jgi:hypothetical protein
MPGIYSTAVFVVLLVCVVFLVCATWAFFEYRRDGWGAFFPEKEEKIPQTLKLPELNLDIKIDLQTQPQPRADLPPAPAQQPTEPKSNTVLWTVDTYAFCLRCRLDKHDIHLLARAQLTLKMLRSRDPRRLDSDLEWLGMGHVGRRKLRSALESENARADQLQITAIPQDQIHRATVEWIMDSPKCRLASAPEKGANGASHIVT